MLRKSAGACEDLDKPSQGKDDGLDIKTFIHMMRSIFIKFRTHSKDMPAKDAEFVDYVILQANPSKKKLFDWMYELGIFFREKHLYIIKLDKMKEYRISMTALPLIYKPYTQTPLLSSYR